MKPRITLAETLLADGSPLELQEHDGRHSLVVRGQQIAGPSTKVAEQECARLACAPFRPVRQPKIWFAGLGLGQALVGASESLLQKKGNLIVAEPLAALVDWQRKFFPEGTFCTDPRVSHEADVGVSGLVSHAGTLHAIIVHTDTAPIGPDGKSVVENRRWLTAAFEALQAGGVLAITAPRQRVNLTRTLERAGFNVAEHLVPDSPSAKKPRFQPIWLARKGKAED